MKNWASCRINGEIDRKLYEVVDLRKNRKLWKLHIGKMWQKNVEKWPKEKSSKPGYHFNIDIAISKFTSAGGSKYWFLAVD